jgi:hypothetical protein
MVATSSSNGEPWFKAHRASGYAVASRRKIFLARLLFSSRVSRAGFLPARGRATVVFAFRFNAPRF